MQLTCGGVRIWERMQNNLQTTVKKKKKITPAKNMGGPPHILLNPNTYGGAPFCFRGPPQFFFQRKNIWGGPTKERGPPLKNY